MTEAFTLDTSGEVRVQVGSSGGETEFARYRWHNLDPFTQGYIEALFASLATPPFTDHPHLQREGVCYGETIVGFSDLAPETLARIIADCAERQRQTGLDSGAHGRAFWKRRQAAGFTSRFPPLTPTLSDDGKVYLREAGQ